MGFKALPKCLKPRSSTMEKGCSSRGYICMCGEASRCCSSCCGFGMRHTRSSRHVLVSPFSSNCTVGWTILICLCRFVVEPALKMPLCFVVFSIFKLQLNAASLSGVTHSLYTQPHLAHTLSSLLSDRQCLPPFCFDITYSCTFPIVMASLFCPG